MRMYVTDRILLPISSLVHNFLISMFTKAKLQNFFLEIYSGNMSHELLEAAVVSRRSLEILWIFLSEECKNFFMHSMYLNV